MLGCASMREVLSSGSLEIGIDGLWQPTVGRLSLEPTFSVVPLKIPSFPKTPSFKCVDHRRHSDTAPGSDHFHGPWYMKQRGCTKSLLPLLIKEEGLRAVFICECWCMCGAPHRTSTPLTPPVFAAGV